MTVLLYAVPADVPAPPPPAFWGLTVVWHGVDGSTWDLSDWTSGVALLLEGVEGLHLPNFEVDALTADGVHGQIATGIRVLPRSVSVKLGIFADTSDDWAELDARFWRSWHPLSTGTLVVSSKRGARSIRLRLSPGDGMSYGYDPNTRGLAVYQLDAVADRPLWAGDPVVRSWSTVEERPFLDPAGSPPFWITPANLIDTASLTNPGDEDVWPVWQVSAEGDDVEVSLTVAGGTIGLEQPIPDGHAVVIDTDPVTGGADIGVLVDGMLVDPIEFDRFLDPYQPRRVPAGEVVPIGISMAGPGRVTASLVPLHWRGLP